MRVYLWKKTAVRIFKPSTSQVHVSSYNAFLNKVDVSLLKIQLLWDVTPCRLVNSRQLFASQRSVTPQNT